LSAIDFLIHRVYPTLRISLAHKTSSYDTKKLLKVIFDKTAFVKFKITNNFKQNIEETHSKQPKIHMKIHTTLWILKITRKKIAMQKNQDFLPTV
jgi:hypothetical protein